MNYTAGHVQGLLREQDFSRTITVVNAPAMGGTSNGYRFLPKIMELNFREHFAPGAFRQIDAKVSGPVILEDGSISQTWTSHRFLGDLGIDSGPRWIRPMVESFRPDTAGLGTSTLHGPASDWS